jgi:hypothetical protein
MNTFQYIIKKIFNLNDIISFDINSIKNNTNYNFFNILVSCIFIQKSYSIQNKYIFFDETINNSFITHDIRNEFINLFALFQRTYNSFSKLANLYRYKKAKIIIEYDLCLNSIKENGKNIFSLIQNSNKYLFNINDLIKIIHNSITNTSHFFNNPLPIKNPYNNVLINKSTLYNIYFYVRTKTLLNPDLLFYFFKTNFNINKFTEQYQYLIRNSAINNYLISSTNYKLHDDIRQMIENFNYSVINKNYQIIIDNDFPKDILIKIMIPYLRLYFLSEYSLMHSTSKMKYKKILRNKLIEFQNFNPIFGRKIYNYVNILSENKIVRKNVVNFNSKHIDFNDKNKDKTTFMESHNSKYNDDNDDEDDEDDEDNFTIIENTNSTNSTNSNFINFNNNLYLINAYQRDEESNFYDELNNTILPDIDNIDNDSIS